MLKLSLVSNLICRYSMSHQNQPNLKPTLNHPHQPQSKRSVLNQDLTRPHPLQTQRPLHRPQGPPHQHQLPHPLLPLRGMSDPQCSQWQYLSSKVHRPQDTPKWHTPLKDTLVYPQGPTLGPTQGPHLKLEWLHTQQISMHMHHHMDKYHPQDTKGDPQDPHPGCTLVQRLPIITEGINVINILYSSFFVLWQIKMIEI